MELKLITKALKFASDKHKYTRRKGVDIPYINHPIEVMDLLVQYASIVDSETLAAALMHDVVEDENVTEDELAELFGISVASIVMEVSDDPLLTKSEQIKAQVAKAPFLSVRAALIKLSDKTSNIKSVIETPPPWQRSTKLKYLKQAKAVVEALPELPDEAKPLLDLFYETLERGLKKFKVRVKSETIKLKILEFIKKSDAGIFLSGDFSDFGDSKSIARELSKLVTKGALVRAGKGIYVKANESVTTHKNGEVGALIEIMDRLKQEFKVIQSKGIGSKLLIKPVSKDFKRILVVGDSRIN